MSKFSVKKPFTVFVAVIAVLVLGVVSYFNMTPDLLPNMDFPYVMIMTTYPGASPEKVEAEVTRPLEQSMSTLEHIVEVSSTSSENYSMVMLEFEESVNMDTIGVDIQQAITTLQASWDDMVGTPYVLKINPSMLPVEVAAVSMFFMDTAATSTGSMVGTPYVLKINPSVLPVEVAAVSMKNMEQIQLTEFLNDTLMNKLEGIPGVARISTSGTIEQQLHVVLDQAKLDALNAQIADLINGQMDEAATELNQQLEELRAAQTQLEEAKAQLDAGKEELANQTAQGEAELNYQQSQLVSTKAQLQDQVIQLQSGKSQLQTTLAVLQALRDGIVTLEDQARALHGELDALLDLQNRASALEQQRAQFEAQIAQIRNDPNLTQEQKDAAIAEIKNSPAYLEMEAAWAKLQADLAVRGLDMVSLKLRIENNRELLEAVQIRLEGLLEQLEAQGLDRESLDAQLEQMQDSLDQIDYGIYQLNSASSQIDSGLLQLKDAAVLLSEQKVHPAGAPWAGLTAQSVSAKGLWCDPCRFRNVGESALRRCL